jgi:hypothetical protein
VDECIKNKGDYFEQTLVPRFQLSDIPSRDQECGDLLDTLYLDLDSGSISLDLRVNDDAEIAGTSGVELHRVCSDMIRNIGNFSVINPYRQLRINTVMQHDSTSRLTFRSLRVRELLSHLHISAHSRCPFLALSPSGSSLSFDPLPGFHVLGELQE